MDDFPDIKVITIVWDLESDELSISYDEDTISYYEAWAVIRHAYKMQDEGLDRKDIEED